MFIKGQLFTFTMHLPEYLRQLRKEKGLNQIAVCEAMHSAYPIGSVKSLPQMIMQFEKGMKDYHDAMRGIIPKNVWFTLYVDSLSPTEEERTLIEKALPSSFHWERDGKDYVPPTRKLTQAYKLGQLSLPVRTTLYQLIDRLYEEQKKKI